MSLLVNFLYQFSNDLAYTSFSVRIATSSPADASNVDESVNASHSSTMFFAFDISPVEIEDTISARIITVITRPINARIASAENANQIPGRLP